MTVPSNTMCFANAKGGVGKTSCAVNVSAMTAQALRQDGGTGRVLVIDTDPQANATKILARASTYGDSVLKDAGKGLYRSVEDGDHLPPVYEVREGLDLVPAGPRFTQKLVADFTTSFAPEGNPEYGIADVSAHAALQAIVARFAADYDLVVFDTAPSISAVSTLKAVTSSCRFVVIPTRAGGFSSSDGVATLATTFRHVVKNHNPDLEILGWILFGEPSNGTRIQAQAAANIERLAPGLPQLGFIRDAKAAAAKAEDSGSLPYEIEAQQKSQDVQAIFEALKRNEEPPRTVTVGPLVQDYAELVRAINSAYQSRLGVLV